MRTKVIAECIRTQKTTNSTLWSPSPNYQSFAARKDTLTSQVWADIEQLDPTIDYSAERTAEPPCLDFNMTPADEIVQESQAPLIHTLLAPAQSRADLQSVSIIFYSGPITCSRVEQEPTATGSPSHILHEILPCFRHHPRASLPEFLKFYLSKDDRFGREFEDNSTLHLAQLTTA